jgi:hypothetical protein
MWTFCFASARRRFTCAVRTRNLLACPIYVCCGQIISRWWDKSYGVVYLQLEISQQWNREGMNLKTWIIFVEMKMGGGGGGGWNREWCQHITIFSARSSQFCVCISWLSAESQLTWFSSTYCTGKCYILSISPMYTVLANTCACIGPMVCVFRIRKDCIFRNSYW